MDVSSLVVALVGVGLFFGIPYAALRLPAYLERIAMTLTNRTSRSF